MSDQNPVCPACNSSHSYQDGNVWICPECFHEWSIQGSTQEDETAPSSQPRFLDANGVPLESGDTVTVVKDLKVSGNTLKSGTKVKNIRLLDEPHDGHDISCKIAGFGSMYLKCSVVKKSK